MTYRLVEMDLVEKSVRLYVAANQREAFAGALLDILDQSRFEARKRRPNFSGRMATGL
jgi:hypothetical protein